MQTKTLRLFGTSYQQDHLSTSIKTLGRDALEYRGTMVYMTRPHKQRQDARTLSCTKNTEQRPSCQPKLRCQRPSSIMHGGRHVSRDRTMQIQRWSSRSTSWASASLKRSGWCGVHHKPTQCKFGKVHHCDLLTTPLQNWNQEQWLAPIQKKNIRRTVFISITIG